MEQLSEKDRDLMIRLVDETKKSKRTLCSELEDIIQYRSECRKKDDEKQKYNTAFAILYQRYSTKTPEPEQRDQQTQFNVNDELAKSALQRPDFVPRLIDEVQKTVAGEKKTILSLILTRFTYKVKCAEPSADNVALSGDTRAGKDHVATETYKLLCDPQDYVHRTRISPRVMDYMQPPGEGWDGVVFHIEDIDNEILEGSTFRTRSSGKRYEDNHVSIVDKGEEKKLTQHGKPVMCTTKQNLVLPQDEQGRHAVIHIDDSELQTHAIKRKQHELQKNEISTVDTDLKHGILYLNQHELVEIEVPFIEELELYFPDTTIMNSVFKRFITYIRTSAFIHHMIRNTDEQGRIIATYEDYLLARMVFMNTVDDHMVTLSDQDQKVVDFLTENSEVTKKDIKDGAGVTKYYIYETPALQNLEKHGVITSIVMEHPKAHKDVLFYSLNKGRTYRLPLYPEGIKISWEQKEKIEIIRELFIDKLADIIKYHNTNGTPKTDITRNQQGTNKDMHTIDIDTTEIGSGILIFKYLCEGYLSFLDKYGDSFVKKQLFFESNNKKEITPAYTTSEIGTPTYIFDRITPVMKYYIWCSDWSSEVFRNRLGVTISGTLMEMDDQEGGFNISSDDEVSQQETVKEILKACEESKEYNELIMKYGRSMIDHLLKSGEIMKLPSGMISSITW